MDSINSTTDSEEFTQEKIDSLKVFLKVIRGTLDNFVKLVPYSSEGDFTLSSLILGGKILNRADAQKNNIETKFVYPVDKDENIWLPFQSILQMVNNLLINSVKALEGVENKRIKVEGVVVGDELIIQVLDNGKEISGDEKEKIFEYGFSTTNGSGIGLFHATHLCTKYSGKILLKNVLDGEYNKVFIITLPINKSDGEKHSDH